MKKNTAFTLAEVMLTIAIIGIVVAITIITLMLNTNRAEFKTGFKKFISSVNQAIAGAIVNDYLDFGAATVGTMESTQSIMSMLSQQMHVAKTVVGSDTDTQKMFGDTDSNYTIFLADGMVLSYPQNAAGCTNFLKADVKRECAGIVDVNGTKFPNKLSNCQYDFPTGTKPDIQSDDIAAGNFCKEDNAFISDQYSVRFKGQLIIPNGYASRYVLYEK